MSMSDAAFAAFATLGSAAIVTFGGYWVSRRNGKKKQDPWPKDILLNHPAFDRIQQLRVVEIRSMTTGSKLKDAVMREYAGIILEVYQDEMVKFARQVADSYPTEPKSAYAFYTDLLKRLDETLAKSGIVQEYLDKTLEASVVLAESMSDEIRAFQANSEMCYVEKIYRMFDAIRLHLIILIKDLGRITRAMNGHLEEALVKKAARK